MNEAEVLARLDKVPPLIRIVLPFCTSFSRYRHCNLVPIVGGCPGPRIPAILYEYTEEGSLYDHIHVVSH